MGRYLPLLTASWSSFLILYSSLRAAALPSAAFYSINCVALITSALSIPCTVVLSLCCLSLRAISSLALTSS